MEGRKGKQAEAFDDRDSVSCRSKYFKERQ